VTIGHAVTLRLDRRSVCAPIRCGALRAHVPADVDVGGWFVTNTHRGPIAFRARRLDVAP